jgi:hypothetical protein
MVESVKSIRAELAPIIKKRHEGRPSLEMRS